MKVLRNPKVLIILLVFGAMFIAGIAGGALGNEFGGGFLGAPIAHLQVPAENITPEPNIGGFHITNTMVTTWAAIVLVLVLAFIATRKITTVPRGLQTVFEVLIEYFENLGEGLAGERAKTFIPLVLTIFIFIVVTNWMGILPGFGTIGWIEPAEELVAHEVHEAEAEESEPDLGGISLNIFDGDGGFGMLGFGSVSETLTGEEYEAWKASDESDGKQAGVLVPFLRSANTDVNTTLAIALVTMFFVHFWAIRSLGFFRHAGKYFNVRQGPIWFFVGILEIISEIARIISFTFRLFGNIFAGEVLLVAMAFLIPLIGILPFLGLELFVGLIQAFIFSMLTLVFASVAGAGHDEH